MSPMCPGGPYIIYQQNTKLVNSQTFTPSVPATGSRQAISSLPWMQFSRQRTCNHLSLIIAALALAIGMQRHWHHHVGTELFRLNGSHLDESRSEPGFRYGFE